MYHITVPISNRELSVPQFDFKPLFQNVIVKIKLVQEKELK